MSHETFPEPLELPLSTRQQSGQALLQAVCTERNLPFAASFIELDRDLVVSIDCEPCGTSTRVMRPLQEVGQRDAICEKCGQMARPCIEHVVHANSELAQAKLCDLGIPAYDLVRVVVAEEEHIVLLAGDRSDVMGPSEHTSDDA